MNARRNYNYRVAQKDAKHPLEHPCSFKLSAMLKPGMWLRLGSPSGRGRDCYFNRKFPSRGLHFTLDITVKWITQVNGEERHFNRLNRGSDMTVQSQSSDGRTVSLLSAAFIPFSLCRSLSSFVPFLLPSFLPSFRCSSQFPDVLRLSDEDEE